MVRDIHRLPHSMAKVKKLSPIDLICIRHQANVLLWAKETFGEAFQPSVQQVRVLTGWSNLLNAKRKAHWNRLHPDQMVVLSAEERALTDKIGMSIQSGHGLSKTTTLVLINLHLLQCFPESRMLVTAPAGPQLQTVIWSEFYKWINANDFTRTVFKWGAKQISLNDEASGADHWIRPRTIDPKATADQQGETLAGLHAAISLRTVDEASGVPDAVMLPFEGGLTDPVALIVMGFNPTRNVGFAIETQRLHRHRWLCFHLDGEELLDNAPPWFNPKAQQELAATYGRDSNFYRVRVRGLPPLAAPDMLIPWDWAMEAAMREAYFQPYDSVMLGVDVAGEGTDRSVIAIRRRDSIIEIHEKRGLDTINVAWWIEEIMQALVLENPTVRIHVGIDSIGIGRGVYDYLKTVKGYRDVHAVNVARRLPATDRFLTIRDQTYWDLRTAFETGVIVIPNHDRLIGELTTFKWSDQNVEGKIRIEDKRSLKKRLPDGQSSPDLAEAVMITQYLRRFFAKSDVLAEFDESNEPFNRRRSRKALSWKTV